VFLALDLLVSTLREFIAYVKAHPGEGRIASNPCERGGRLYAADRAETTIGRTSLARIMLVIRGSVPDPAKGDWPSLWHGPNSSPWGLGPTPVGWLCRSLINAPNVAQPEVELGRLLWG
jgi:hypothetical protein